MRWNNASLVLALAVAVLGAPAEPASHAPYRRATADAAQNQTKPAFLNDRSSAFAVNGSAIPLVDFDVGESYAGLLPLGNDTDSQLYFWFFPSANPAAQENKEILIYLTGGPGCSSVGELLQSNGPISWQSGRAQPIQNKWSWNRLTNVVWIDQPVGTGYSQGTPTATNEEDVAEQFLGFWQNFVDTFALQGYQVYVTASSYGGMYAPFISSAMLDRNDTTYFNVSGMAVWDGLYSKIPLTEDILVASFVDKHKGVLAFNDSFTAGIAAIDQQCGYSAYLDEFLVFPPAGQQPSLLPGEDPLTNIARTECALYVIVFLAAKELNPCLNAFDINAHCPVLFDPLGLSSGTFTLPPSFPPPYFDLPEVKSALHAPADTTWTFCKNPANPNDTVVFSANGGIDGSINSGPGSQPVLPRVIDATGNVILGHGSRDFLVLPESTLLTIQNLTWQGQMGFQNKPESVLFVPSHDNSDFGMATASGVVGSSHSERGLTWFGAALAGHLVGQDQPAVTFRMVEVLLGRVEGFESTDGFSVDVGGDTAPFVGDLGKGTVKIGDDDDDGQGVLGGLGDGVLGA